MMKKCHDEYYFMEYTKYEFVVIQVMLLQEVAFIPYHNHYYDNNYTNHNDYQRHIIGHCDKSYVMILRG